MRRTFHGVLLLVVLLATPSVSFAQTFGQITGQVTDTSGAVLAGASVTVTNTQTNAVREAVTNSSGSYVFPNLLPGVYSVKVDLQGFQSRVANNVELQVQQTARIDFSMELGSLEVAVEVTGSAPMINVTDATVGTVIENKQILELPLNGRNFINLVSLSPNVSSDYAGGNGGGASGRQGGDRSSQNFSVAGQRREYNQYTLDGIVNQDVNFNTYAFLPSIDSVEEFKVQTGVYSAEFGREVAQVNVSTKSGTNTYHGTIFEFIRNDAFDAAPYQFTSVKPQTSPFKWNQYGFTLGGPIVIPGLFNGANRLFFMSNFEGFRLRQQQEAVFSTPSVAMRNGDFSGANVTIRDPQTGQPFPGNQIPRNRLDPIAIKLLEWYPEPNIPGAGLSRNYLALQQNVTDKDQFTQRIDFVENSKSFWFGRYSWTDEYVLAPNLKDNGQVVETNVKQAMISNTRTLSPSLVNEFRFGMTKFYNNLAQELQYKRNVHEEVGLGLFIPPPVGWGLPNMSVGGGFSGFGDNPSLPFTGNNYVFQFIDNVSWIKGNHSMRMGAEVRNDHYNMIGTQEIRGSLNIDRPVTGYGFADYMLGIISGTRSAGALGEGWYRAISQAYFIQDTYRIKPTVTLDLGLRYEYTPPWTDVKNEMMNIWIPPGFGTPSQQGKPCFVRVGSGDVYENVATRFDPAICVTRDGRLGDRLIKPDYNDFAPRLGAVWSPSPKMTVRTGYGIFYAQDSTNPVFDMSRNIQGRITAQNPTLTLAQPYDGGATNPCGVRMPPQVCVTAPQVLGNEYDRHTPWVEQYLLNFQREVGASTAIEIGYFGSRGHNLQRFISLNQPVPGTSTPILSRAPAPELGNWQLIAGVGHSIYNGLAMKVTRRMANGFSGLASYTLSKSEDNGSGLRSPGEPLKPQQGDCWECEYGRSVFDVRHRVTASFLYELPIGSGRKYLSRGGVLDVIAGGWQIGGMLRMSSGFPLTITSGVDRSNTAHGYDRPSAVPGVAVELDNPSPAAWFNIAAFQMPAFGTFGNLGRATVTGPGVFTIDASALKNFQFGGSKYLQLRIECFNLLNTPNWADPNTNLAQSDWQSAPGNIPTPGSGAFGTINSIRGTVPMRQLQFALKFVF
jgi:hypothetical protein